MTIPKMKALPESRESVSKAYKSRAKALTPRSCNHSKTCRFLQTPSYQLAALAVAVTLCRNPTVAVA